MNAIESTLAAASVKTAAADFPSTEQWLVQGGDARIVLNPATGANKYGCRPQPDLTIAAFGSATATTISEAAFFAAGQLRNRLAQQVAGNDPGDVYADGMSRVRHELVELCGLSNSHGLDIVFAASGTDCHLIAAELVAGQSAGAARMLMVDEAETGSGVPAALSARHSTAMPDSPGNARGAAVAIPLRLADGTPRPGADIDADFERQVVAAAAAGQRVLLTMVDVSKTGMIAPSVACAVELQRRFPDMLEILVDACQFRIAPETLRAYLAQGFMVGITGSKFVTGPSFSGALLIPAALSGKLRDSRIGNNLQACSFRADWPTGWPVAKQFDAAPNFGLLLRWEAALKELRAFRAISNAAATHFLQAFAVAVRQRLDCDPVFDALAVPELQRQPFADSQSWDAIQTIFSFRLCRPSSATDKEPLKREEVMQVYLALQAAERGDLRVQLAQPVACGMRAGEVVSALRLCASSRLIVEAVQQNGRNEAAVIARALDALDQVARVVRAMG